MCEDSDTAPTVRGPRDQPGWINMLGSVDKVTEGGRALVVSESRGEKEQEFSKFLVIHKMFLVAKMVYYAVV